MAKKVLTKEDFEEDKGKEDTSSDDIPADQKFDEEGNPIEEGPEKEAEPSEKKEKKDDKESPKPSEDDKDGSKFKHKTWEETEKARQTLEKDFHTKSTENAELKRKLAQYEKPPEKPKTIDDRVAEITDDTLKQIKMLPLEYDSTGKPTQESATKRDRDAAILWNKMAREISRLEIDEREDRRETEQKIVKKTYKRATDEGIKTDAELRILGHEFSKTDPNLSTDERINGAIESTKEILSQIRDGFVEKQEKDKKEKDDLRVLGRHSSRQKGKEDKETKPTSMSQQLAELNESRRMKKEDLARW